MADWKGKYVKVVCNGERFWVEVLEDLDARGLLKTRIDNKVFMQGDAKFNDILWVEPKDIIQVFK